MGSSPVRGENYRIHCGLSSLAGTIFYGGCAVAKKKKAAKKAAKKKAAPKKKAAKKKKTAKKK
jgi:hypothetical protein